MCTLAPTFTLKHTCSYSAARSIALLLVVHVVVGALLLEDTCLHVAAHPLIICSKHAPAQTLQHTRSYSAAHLLIPSSTLAHILQHTRTRSYSAGRAMKSGCDPLECEDDCVLYVYTDTRDDWSSKSWSAWLPFKESALDTTLSRHTSAQQQREAVRSRRHEYLLRDDFAHQRHCGTMKAEASKQSTLNAKALWRIKSRGI
eukprot:1158066-Pelagomonas_calceolata.AAC.1